jgi:hypothetical protein
MRRADVDEEATGLPGDLHCDSGTKACAAPRTQAIAAKETIIFPFSLSHLYAVLQHGFDKTIGWETNAVDAIRTTTTAFAEETLHERCSAWCKTEAGKMRADVKLPH